MCPPIDSTLLDAKGSPPPDDLKVDAFCIGAPKSGSTWLARVVDEHPEIQVSKPKEPFFFTSVGSPYRDIPPDNFMSSWEWYRSCFPEESKVNMDFSIHTMADPEAPKRIAKVFPGARFILILRDPATRLYSHYRMEERKKQEGFPGPQNMEPTFEEALANEKLVQRSRYAVLLEPWLDVYPKSRFHVVVLEEARQHPIRAVQEIFRYLEVDDEVEPPRIDRKVHPVPVKRGLQRTLSTNAIWARQHGLKWLVDPISRRFPYRLLKRLDNKKVRYPPLDGELENELRQRFLPDVERLEDMLELELDVWKP